MWAIAAAEATRHRLLSAWRFRPRRTRTYVLLLWPIPPIYENAHASSASRSTSASMRSLSGWRSRRRRCTTGSGTCRWGRERRENGHKGNLAMQAKYRRLREEAYARGWAEYDELVK